MLEVSVRVGPTGATNALAVPAAHVMPRGRRRHLFGGGGTEFVSSGGLDGETGKASMTWQVKAMGATFAAAAAGQAQAVSARLI